MTVRFRGFPLGAALVALLLVAGTALAALAPVGSDFRISSATGAGAGRDAFATDVAYNPAANEFLVVWYADALADDANEIFGQRVSATGAELGGDFRISNTTDAGTGRDAFNPNIAYNPAANEYLVVWEGDGLAATDDEFEIFGQRVSAGGVPDAQGDFRISDVGMDADPSRGAFIPAVAFNPTTNEYLVAWEGDDLATDDEFEIFGQRVSAAGVPDVMQDDFRISNVPTDTDPTADGLGAGIAYSPGANEYLVAWQGDPSGGDVEIYGQRVSAAGVPDVQGDFRISNASDVAAFRDAVNAALAFNPAANEYLVTWQGTAVAPGKEEIFGQRVSGAGSELGTDFRISNTGGDGDASREGTNPSVAYNPTANDYAVVWDGDGFSADEEFEIFGQRVTAAGAETGSDFRISTTGGEGDPSRGALSPALAYNPAANEYLAVWFGDGLGDDQFEIFGRRLGEVAEATPAAAAKCAGKSATKVGTAARNVINGTGKRDVIAALGGNDLVRGLGGNDILCGGKGKDILNGGKGKDLLRGEKGKDLLRGAKGKDKLKGGPGADKLVGGPGKDKLSGGAGKDQQSQ